MASFGATKLSECRWKPGGFTRLTPEVLNWVNNVTGMKDPGIMDPGKMIIVQHSFYITTLFQLCLSPEDMILSNQQRFIILTSTLPVSSKIYLIGVGVTLRMDRCCVEADAGIHTDHAGDGIQTLGPGNW